MSFLIKPIKEKHRGYKEIGVNDELDLVYTADSKDFIVRDDSIGYEYFISGEVVNSIKANSDLNESEVIDIISVIDRAFGTLSNELSRSTGKLNKEDKIKLNLSIDDLVELLSVYTANFSYETIISVFESIKNDNLVDLFNGNRLNEQKIMKILKYYPAYPAEVYNEENEYESAEDKFNRVRHIRDEEGEFINPEPVEGRKL